MRALLAVVQVRVESLGLVTLPPCHVVPGEESAGLLDGGHGELGLVVIIHLEVRRRGGEGERERGGGGGEGERGR